MLVGRNHRWVLAQGETRVESESWAGDKEKRGRGEHSRDVYPKAQRGEGSGMSVGSHSHALYVGKEVGEEAGEAASVSSAGLRTWTVHLGGNGDSERFY